MKDNSDNKEREARMLKYVRNESYFAATEIYSSFLNIYVKSY